MREIEIDKGKFKLEDEIEAVEEVVEVKKKGKK